MASLENLIQNLRKKKQEATNLRKKTEKQLQEVRSLERRSSSGLHSIDRKIESEREDAIGISDILNQKMAQLESIERLVAAAKERIIRDKETLNQTEQELEFSQNPEEKQNIESRLTSLNDHIEELEYEINEFNSPSGFSVSITFIKTCKLCIKAALYMILLEISFLLAFIATSYDND